MPAAARLDELLGRLEGLLPLVAAHADWTDAARRPHDEVMRGLARAGLLRLLAPAHYGGAGLTLVDFLTVVEATAAVDGSAGWTLMTSNEELEIASAYLPAATISGLLADRADLVVAGSGLTSGRARQVEGGWVVEGRWRFVTGSPAADHLVLGNLVVDTDERRAPRSCYALLPVERTELVDTWHVDGLRGTGSGDVVVDGLFVEDAWTGVIRSPLETVPVTTLYRLPSTLRFPIPKTAVAAGIARAAIGDLVELAGTKTPVTSRTQLRDRPDVARTVAEAVALRASGWSWVREVTEELWSFAAAGERIPRALHARARLAASSSVRNSVRAVELVCSAAGSTANFAGSPLSRRFRDVHAVPQHFTVAPYQMATAGRVLLGLPADDPAF